MVSRTREDDCDFFKSYTIKKNKKNLFIDIPSPEQSHSIVAVLSGATVGYDLNWLHFRNGRSVFATIF
jgi:hypothetical protein